MAPGTIDYMPYEALVNGAVYGTKLDMFSFGILVLNVVTQSWPTPSMQSCSKDSTGKLGTHSEVERRANLFKKMDANDVLMLIAERCVHNDPDARLAAEEVAEKLESVVMVPTSQFLPLLKLAVEKEVAETRRNQPLKMCEGKESQLHMIIQDMYNNYTLSQNWMSSPSG